MVKQFQFYGWNPFDFHSSVDVQMMSPMEVYLYRELLDRLWMANPQGYLPDDPRKLATLTRLRFHAFTQLFRVVSQKFERVNGLIYNERILRELEYCRQLHEKQSDKGRSGAAARWKRDGTGNAPAIAQAMAQGMAPSVLVRSTCTQEEKPPTPPPASPAAPPPQKEGVRDYAFDEFAELFQEKFGMVCAPEKKNFVQLASLRKKLKLEGKATPEDWSRALKNFFESPLSAYSLADLCSRYHLFRQGSLDRYGKLAPRRETDEECKARISKWLEPDPGKPK